MRSMKKKGTNKRKKQTRQKRTKRKLQLGWL